MFSCSSVCSSPKSRFFGEMESMAFALTAFTMMASSFVPSETMKEVLKSLLILLLSSFTCTTLLPEGATVPSLSETVMQSEVMPSIFQLRFASPVFFISNVCSCAVSPKSNVVGDTLISGFLSSLGEQEIEMGNELPKAERFTTTDFDSPSLSRLAEKTMLCVLLLPIRPAFGLAESQLLLPNSRVHSVSVFPLLVMVTDISSCVVPKFSEEGVIVISASFFSGVSRMSPEAACPTSTFTDLVSVTYPIFCACT